MSYTDITILNVGAGSCAVVAHPSGRQTMVDINDGGELRSYEKDALATAGTRGMAKLIAERLLLTDPVTWYRSVYGTSLWRFILSHPDADHMAGIRRVLKEQQIKVAHFWDIPHSRTRTRDDCKGDADWQDWLAYRQFRNDETILGVTWPQRLAPLRGRVASFWDEDQIDILSPTTALIAGCDKADVYNDASYVLRVRHADTALLLPADAESPAWTDMRDAGVPLRSHILVASHHGRKSGYDEDSVSEINPNVVIVSTGPLDPKDDGVPLYKKHTDDVFSTRDHGNIHVRMHDDGSFGVSDHNGNQLTAYQRLVSADRSLG